MKITRKQLRKIISESMYDPKHGMKSLEEPYKSKIMSTLDNPDASPEDQKQFHHLADTVSDYKDPRPGMPDDSMVGIKAQQAGYLKNAKYQIATYLPGFLNLPEDMIEGVVEFVFLSKNPTLHINLDDDMLEEELGEDTYRKASMYNLYTLPENAEIVKIVEDYRNNSKSYDVKFYNMYAPTCLGVNPFAKLDPYINPNSGFASHRGGDPQTGYFDGFYEEYKKVTTEKSHIIDSYIFDQAFIEMMRDLRPDHDEQVVN
tara:strand:- start:292 stop:1068 length:777 start_codon:yes stop_codon:yes gene_type:complete